jgi:hypothetical protein
MAAAAAEKVVAYHTVSIDSTSINFPFQPYELQIEYMRKVLECVREGRQEDIPPSLFFEMLIQGLRIPDILVRIRIRGSLPMPNGSGSGSCHFRQ